MRLSDVGWCWEGQALDPQVPPSVLGVGDGARYLGLKRAVFLFHELTDLAMERLADMEEVVADISKWLPAETESGAYRLRPRADLDTILREADKVGAFSLRYPNLTGAIHDDMLQLIEREGVPRAAYGRVVEALRRRNPSLRLWNVVYTHELDPAKWRGLVEFMDVINLWVWTGPGDLDREIPRCRDIFGDRPIVLGVYLRDYERRIPQPIPLLQDRFERILRHLDAGRIAGFHVIATSLIEFHREQADWVRDFIARHDG